MDIAETLIEFQGFLSGGNAGPILLKAGLWFLVAIVIIASTDTVSHRQQDRNLKANLSLLFLFLLLCGGLVYMLFGYVPLT